MNINVLNMQYEVISVVDDYTSLMWCKRYNDVGALDLQIEASKENLNIFKKGFYITRNDDDCIYRIENFEIETDSEGNDNLIVGAVDCKCILNQRITWSQIFLNNSDVQSFIYSMLNNNFINPTDTKRKINLIFDNNSDLLGVGEVTTRQSTYELIGDKIIELCSTYNLGHKVYLNKDDKNFHFALFQGVNRSIDQRINPLIIFSPNYENVFSSKYKFDMSQMKNVALVGGEGEGDERKLKEVGSMSGLERREMFVDAKSVKSDEGVLDYFDILLNEGKSKLSEKTASSNFEAEIDSKNNKYKLEYDLGDIVTVENKYGVMMNARIIEIIETWDSSGYTIEPVFEYIEPDVEMSKVILTEDSDGLMTETSDFLIYEEPDVSENEPEETTEQEV